MKKKLILLLSSIFIAISLLSGCGKSGIQEYEIPDGGVIACVGDSTSFGAAIANESSNSEISSYPAILNSLLGDNWDVLSCAAPGVTLQKEGMRPYVETTAYQDALDAKADIYLIMLGTNDSNDEIWDEDSYKTQLKELVDSFLEANPDALIYLMSPPQVYVKVEEETVAFGVNEVILTNETVSAVKTVATENNLGFIDINSFTANHQEWFADGVHPNNTGKSAIAQYIYNELLGVDNEIVLDFPTIGCIGDSLTFGAGVMKARDTESYPARLQTLLGESAVVTNYGLVGKTLLSGTGFTYKEHSIFNESKEAGEDIYIIMLGTNDAKNSFWNAEKFREELKTFIADYQNLSSNPKIFLMTPPSVYINAGETSARFDINKDYIDNGVYDIVKETAEEMNVTLIDIYAITANHPEWFADGVHPNAEGNAAIAKAVYVSLASSY